MHALPREIDLFHQPSNTNYLATIVKLTSELVVAGMGDAWWKDKDITLRADDPPVDLGWPWLEAVEESEGGRLPPTTRFLAVLTGDNAVQGAMMVAGTPRSCTDAPNLLTIYIEAIATAPRNRSELRTDKGNWLQGIGLHLLEWAVDLSMDVGCEGRLELCASLKGVPWYRKRGFIELDVDKKNYDGIEYTPMQLTAAAAAEFKRSQREAW